MCVLYRGGYHEYRGGYHEYCGEISLEYRGVFSIVGAILSTVGDIMMHMGQYHEYHGGVFSTMGDTILCNLSTIGDIMIHVGDIKSTVGCLVPWG